MGRNWDARNWDGRKELLIGQESVRRRSEGDCGLVSVRALPPGPLVAVGLRFPRAARAPPHSAKKEVQARPLVRVICHSPLRPAGRGLAVIGSAQARNVTREKSEWGPQRQVVIFGGSEA